MFSMVSWIMALVGSNQKLSTMNVCRGGGPVQCRLLSSTLDLYLLDPVAHPSLPVMISKNVSRLFPLRGQNL